MRKWLKRIGLAIVLAGVGIQLIPGGRPEPAAVDAAQSLPMHPVFARACADCHSNETRWPWYSHVAPTSWWVTGHVNHARRHMNLSEWKKYDAARADHKLKSICRMVSDGRMPLPSYLPMHPDARLTPEDVKALCEWTEQERARLTTSDRIPARPTD